MQSEERIEQLLAMARKPGWIDAFEDITSSFHGGAVFTTSFSNEDQAILSAIAEKRLAVRVVTLDTGRLFEAIHQLHSRTRERYGIPIQVYAPDPDELRDLVERQGPNGFYNSPENRLECCRVRKIEPVRRALAGAGLWITGIRREHSQGRSEIKPVEWDEGHGLLKYHPLLDVSGEELKRYLSDNAVPTNPLYELGFESIGCAPCTRAIAPGEPARSGRWWWEQIAHKECGLHLKNGKIVGKTGGT